MILVVFVMKRQYCKILTLYGKYWQLNGEIFVVNVGKICKHPNVWAIFYDTIDQDIGSKTHWPNFILLLELFVSIYL